MMDPFAFVRGRCGWFEVGGSGTAVENRPLVLLTSLNVEATFPRIGRHPTTEERILELSEDAINILLFTILGRIMIGW